MQFFKDHGKTIVMVLAVVLTLIGFKVTQGEGGQIIINPPADVVEPVNVKGVTGPTSASSPQVGMIRIRARAAAELADQQGWKGVLGFARAWNAVAKVKTDDIVAGAILAGFTPPVGEFGDGQILKKIVDWFLDPANQEKIRQFIAFIIQMAMLFAQTPFDPATWPAALASFTAC